MYLISEKKNFSKTKNNEIFQSIKIELSEKRLNYLTTVPKENDRIISCHVKR